MTVGFSPILYDIVMTIQPNVLLPLGYIRRVFVLNSDLNILPKHFEILPPLTVRWIQLRRFRGGIPTDHFGLLHASPVITLFVCILDQRFDTLNSIRKEKAKKL